MVHSYSRDELEARLGVPDRRHVPPIQPRAGLLGMRLFLASLAVLFAASMVGYGLINWSLHRTRTILNDQGDWVTVTPDVPPIHMPVLLWLSTAVILASSLTIHLAHQGVKRERQRDFRRWLTATSVLAVLFVLVQVPSLVLLLREHVAALPDTPPTASDPAFALVGLIVALIIIHALHVLGGVIPLIIVNRNAYRGRYDHESHNPVTMITMYWHFLDIVWIFMFVVLLATA